MRTELPPADQCPPSHCSESGEASSISAAISSALSRSLRAVIATFSPTASLGAALKLLPVPKRSVSSWTTLTSSAGIPSSSAAVAARSASVPWDASLRLSTALPVGCIRMKTAR